MKKIMTITAALALTASFAGAASAATETTETETTATPVEVSTTVTETTYSTDTTESSDDVIVKPGDGIDLPLLPYEITQTTYFYNTPNGDSLGALGSQFVSVTGNKITNVMTGDTWIEIYTWKGAAWINTGKE